MRRRNLPLRRRIQNWMNQPVRLPEGVIPKIAIAGLYALVLVILVSMAKWATKTPSRPNSGDSRPHYERRMELNKIKYEKYIMEYAGTYNVDPAMVATIIDIESSFRPNAVSKAGAVGLMQITPITAKHLRVTELHNPRVNIEAGTRYLAELLGRFDTLELVLAAYYYGPRIARNDDKVLTYCPMMAYISKYRRRYVKYNEHFNA